MNITLEKVRMICNDEGSRAAEEGSECACVCVSVGVWVEGVDQAHILWAKWEA